MLRTPTMINFKCQSEFPLFEFDTNEVVKRPSSLPYTKQYFIKETQKLDCIDSESELAS